MFTHDRTTRHQSGSFPLSFYRCTYYYRFWSSMPPSFRGEYEWNSPQHKRVRVRVVLRNRSSRTKCGGGYNQIPNRLSHTNISCRMQSNNIRSRHVVQFLSQTRSNESDQWRRQRLLASCPYNFRIFFKMSIVLNTFFIILKFYSIILLIDLHKIVIYRTNSRYLIIIPNMK